MNLAHLLARAARVFPERVALARGTRPHATHRELARRAAAIAGALRTTFGCAPGDRVALFMKNVPEYWEALLGAWWAGLAAVPVNAKLHPKELEFILGDAGARVCFTTPDLAESVAPVYPAAKTVVLDDARWRAMTAGAPLAGPQDVDPTDVAWLFYTSGTTGRPKGVMLTHRNLFAMNAAYFVDVDTIAPDDCTIHAAPMSHGAGLYGIPHLAAGVTQVVTESGGFEPAEIFELCRTWRGVAMFAAPTMVKRMVDHARNAHPPLDGLKTVIYGGGPMYAADIVDALGVMGPRFAQIYGQGESPMTITALSRHHLLDAAHPRHAERIASVGVAQTGVEVRVVDERDAALPPGEIGEILVRGDVVMRGYWNNPDATAKALAGGWLHTGDVGSLDADGFLTLRDRSKDLVIVGGSNVYPREVEEVLLRHPAVHECSVVGRPHPEYGEETVAFIVRAPGADVSAAALDALCLEHIARFKRPRHYRFIDALPKNNYGKVLKTALRERLAAEPDA
jgi:long-chain acyl-CoA synthetase